MDKQTMVELIISKEWPMFHSVNGDEERADCQNNYATFHAMRAGQFSAWDEATVQSYLNDVTQAENCGRNIVREKYIHMMRSSAPKEYEQLAAELPKLSMEKLALTERIWQKLLAQTLRMRKQYPSLGAVGRPLYSSQDYTGTSIETYQKGELLTYSEDTLASLYNCICALEEKGTDLSTTILEESLKLSGYKNLAEAEQAAAAQLRHMRQREESQFCCCEF